MYRINDYVVYKKDVCRVVDIKENYIKDKDYYSLVPVYDSTLKIDVPVSSNLLRDVIAKEDVQRIIDDIPNIDIIDNDSKLIENIYNDLLRNGDYIDLIKIIKTTYLRNDDRIKNKKKISEKDMYYFNLAEKYLYSEFSVALGIGYDETKEYVIKCVSGDKEKGLSGN